MNRSQDAAEQAHSLRLQEEHQQSQQRIVMLEAQLADGGMKDTDSLPQSGVDPALVRKCTTRWREQAAA